MGKNILKIRDLVIQFSTDDGLVEAVNGVDLDLNEGDVLGLVGETGAGKTTTALGILRLVPDPPGKITGGSIEFDGEDLLAKSPKEMRSIRGRDIAMIFQDPMTALNPVIRVDEQIAEIVRAHDKSLTKRQSIQKALDMLEMVGIPAERGGDYPHQFSGGMKQRVVIAIALACSPKLLIADEPTTALDVTIQAQVLKMIGDLKEKVGTSIIMITHDLGVVAETCNRVAIMYAGEIVESGSLEDVFDHTCHPYTKGLFGSIPSLDEDVERLSPIPGLMPDPSRLPTGCKFHPRCSQACEICETEAPRSRIVSAGHIVRCHCCGGAEMPEETR